MIMIHPSMYPSIHPSMHASPHDGGGGGGVEVGVGTPVNIVTRVNRPPDWECKVVQSAPGMKMMYVSTTTRQAGRQACDARHAKAHYLNLSS